MTKSTDEETVAEPAASHEDSEVGYGRPPRATRFKPGISGNPHGRPKGSRNRAPSKSALLAICRKALKGDDASLFQAIKI